jgi:template-activating factor I
MNIQWKHDSQNLTKLYPRVTDPAAADGEDDLAGDAGSFFNFFEHATDPYEVRVFFDFFKKEKN